MAEGKKSFISYCEWGEIFDSLTDQDAGQLVKHLYQYVRDLDPQTDNKLVEAVFIGMRQTLKRDLKKYEVYTEKQRLNGKKGGRPKKPKEPKKPKPFSENPTEPKKADIVSDSVSDSVIENKGLIDDDVEKKSKSNADVFFDIQKCKEYYLSNDKIIDAVSSNKANAITKEQIPIRLEKFNNHLTENGETLKTFKDYCSHFKSWHKKNKNSQTPVRGQSHKGKHL